MNHCYRVETKCKFTLVVFLVLVNVLFIKKFSKLKRAAGVGPWVCKKNLEGWNDSIRKNNRLFFHIQMSLIPKQGVIIPTASCGRAFFQIDFLWAKWDIYKFKTWKWVTIYVNYINKQPNFMKIFFHKEMQKRRFCHNFLWDLRISCGQSLCASGENNTLPK